MKDDKGSGKRDGQVENRKRRAARAAEADTYVGSVLRSAYQETVDEGVPDELMNLLSRLD